MVRLFFSIMAIIIFSNAQFINGINFHSTGEDSQNSSINNCYQNPIIRFEDKLYLSPGNIYISNDKIYINIYNQLFHVDSLHSDETGLFIYETQTPKPLYWTCENGHLNYYTDYPECIFCGAGPRK